MIFGLDYDDPRRIAKNPFRNWQRWFAWYPITLDSGQLVWWETVEYKLEGHYGGDETHYQLLNERHTNGGNRPD